MPVPSNDGKAQSTKLERIGRRSTADRGAVFNNIGHVIDADMLRTIYRQLDGKKAAGGDGVTKEQYGVRLEENLKDLMARLRRGQYRPKPSRLVEIPKEDGSTRPLAISCFEDKLVQQAVSAVLNAIYEPVFLSCSFGFRPGKSCHEALRALASATYEMPDGAVVEIDIRKYFNSIPLGPLRQFLRRKIADRRFLALLDALVTAPILVDGQQTPNEMGCPQGSGISPVLANVYLHYVVDEWFDAIRRPHFTGPAREVRYADDLVFVFAHRSDAERFFKVLPQRLQKFGLELHADKSSIVPSGRIAAARARREGKRLPTYSFLGFTCYWGLAASKKFLRLKYTSRADRFSAKLKGLRAYLWKNLTVDDTKYFLKRVAAVVRGWVNYHAISDNDRRVGGFVLASKRAIFRWLRRRGGRKRPNWERLAAMLNQAGFPEHWKTTSMFPKPKGFRPIY